VDFPHPFHTGEFKRKLLDLPPQFSEAVRLCSSLLEDRVHFWLLAFKLCQYLRNVPDKHTRVPTVHAGTQEGRSRRLVGLLGETLRLVDCELAASIDCVAALNVPEARGWKRRLDAQCDDVAVAGSVVGTAQG